MEAIYVFHEACLYDARNISLAAVQVNSFFSNRALKLKEITIYHSDLQGFSSCLRSLENIQKLTAFRSSLREEDLTHISEMPNLKSLVLHDNFIYYYDLTKASYTLKSFMKNLNGKKLQCFVLSNCKGFDESAFEELSKQYFPELEALYIGQQLVVENPEVIINRIIQNCPRLNHINLKGGFSYIPNSFLLDILKDFNVRITIEGKVSSNGKKYISKKKSFEDFLKKHDYQLFEKYKEMEQQSKWLAK